MLQARSSFWTHAKNRTISPPPPSRQGRLFPPCRDPCISMRAPRQPDQLNSVPSIHMRYKITASLRATATLALRRPFRLVSRLPKPSVPTISARGSAARRLPRRNTCATWRHRTSRLAGPIDFPGGMASSRQSDIGPDILDRLKRVGSSIVALKQSAVIGPTPVPS